MELVEQYSKMMSFEGRKNRDARVNVSEALTTADANILIPKVISQVVVEAAEPLYLASQFFQRVQLNEGRSMEFIQFGAIRAFEIGEGQEYPNQLLNIATQGMDQSVSVKVKKYGLKVQITDEMISDSQWDVIGLHLRAAGRALARKKEEVIFEEFNKHGHVVFDAGKYALGQDGYPTGRGFDGNYNGTLTAEDMIDMAVSIMSAGFTPTDIIMHPLTWALFAKNAMLMENDIAAFGQGQYFKDPREFNANNSLGLNIIFSPFVPFDAASKKFDFYVLDRNNIGVLLVKDEISTEQFDDPLRDIQTLKLKERYGVGILYGGLGIAVARNISYAKTWPAPERTFEPGLPMPVDYLGTNVDGSPNATAATLKAKKDQI
jgi:HK97 family phage major capsid protein